MDPPPEESGVLDAVPDLVPHRRFEDISRGTTAWGHCILVAPINFSGGAGNLDLRQLSTEDPQVLSMVLSVLNGNQTTFHRRAVCVSFVTTRDDDDDYAQRRFYRALEESQALGLLGFFGPLESNELTTLLESLPRLVRAFSQLLMIYIVFSDKAEVELLAAAVGPKSESLQTVLFLGLVSSNNEHSMGFLDPILHAMSQRHQQPARLCLGGYTRPIKADGPSLVTVEALRLYLQSAAGFNEEELRVLCLTSLGLGDDHCKVIAESLVQCNRSSKGALGALELMENPAIGQEGYAYILWLLNCAHWLGKVTVDDKSWQAEFHLVANMNSKGRGEFLQSGVFASKIEWVEWLARLAALDEENEKADDPNTLNFLWYTLSEKPEFISY
jgi:hypothetical protein